MDFLDLRTILIGFTLCDLVCAFVLISLWWQNRQRYNGLFFWVVDFGLNFFGMLLLALRGQIPDFFSMFLGNLCIVLGTWFLFLGTERFLNVKKKQIQNIILLVVFIGLQSFFIYINPNLSARNILVSAVMVILCAQMTWTLFTHRNVKIREITHWMGFFSVIYVLIGVFRIVIEILYPSGEHLFEATVYEQFIYLAFQTIYIALTFFLFLMVNRRLFIDLESDIDERLRTEAELTTSQEKFIKAFQSSPTAAVISKMKDGKFLEINSQFEKLTGFSRDELLANTSLSLGFWVFPEERKKMINQIEEKGLIQDFAFDGRQRSGRLIKCLFSGTIININQEKCMISYISDVTDKRIIEEVIRIRLALWEYSADHNTMELMQKTLDEIEELTRSKIGFFHMFDSDSNEIILQAWSTKTRDKFCKAQGEGMHYALDQAGVWCDGVRMKKPIFHNDYSSLPEKKGLPEGHAEVVRELVVPIMRNKKVVAVLGIGNKAEDYTQEDLELVNNVADVVWPIIHENRSEEEILILNTKLERLAMIDDLTGLANRRAFFARGGEELQRTRRYRSPLSIIMLDIDKFKNINDTFGHEYGDKALQSFARILQEHVREVDVAGRLGGEEFGILLPNTNANEAMVLAERLRRAVAEFILSKEDQRIFMTASFGVAEFNPQIENIDGLLKNADMAMYQSKNQGRNRVTIYTELDN